MIDANVDEYRDLFCFLSSFFLPLFSLEGEDGEEK
jgi:hypothetical protein